MSILQKNRSWVILFPSPRESVRKPYITRVTRVLGPCAKSAVPALKGEDFKRMNILVLNLGSTSTKLGVFDGTRQLLSHTIRHSKEELSAFPGILEQEGFRRGRIGAWLSENGWPLTAFDIIAARGGLLRPIPGGVFLVDDAVAEDAASGRYGQHPANVGLLIARRFSQEYGIPAVFTDAPATDELSGVARVSGYRPIARRSIFHALNIKRAARQHCLKEGLNPDEARLIVAHMGGGITVAAVDGLKAVDVNNGVDGEGPFSPERAGSLPLRQTLKLAGGYEGGCEAFYDQLYRQGGLMSYFGTNDVEALAQRAQSEPEVALVLDAMLYGIAKQIAAMAIPLKGKPQGILLTGGIAFNRGLMDKLAALVDWLAPCHVYPGEDELAALAEGAFRYLTGQEEAKRLGE